MSDHAEHGHSLKSYAVILLGLFFLTGITVAAALVDFGHPWSDLVALGIALSKASLVVLFFMHVKESSTLIKITAAGGFFWFIIFVVLTLNDIATRPLVEGW